MLEFADDRNEPYDVIGLGASSLDIVNLVDHFPQTEEVQQAFELILSGGGPVATAIVTLARLGARTAMVDALGEDWRSEFILKQFLQEGVDSRFILTRPGQTSSTSCILVKRSTGERAIVHTPGSVADLDPDEVPSSAIQAARFLHLNGRHLKACLKAARRARMAGVKVSFDGGANRYRPEMRALIALSDICIVARQFSEACTGSHNPDEAARRLLEMGPGIVVITEGVKGSRVYANHGLHFYQPAFAMPEVVDTTGCGDSFHGAFLFGLLHQYSLEQSAEFASAAAALNTQALGGRKALPTLKEVEQFLSS
jgi:sulfofructose kinase